MLVAAACLVALVIELPYYTIGPGSARATEPTVSVEGAESFPGGDDLLFTTVTISNGRVNGFEWLEAQVAPDMDLLPADRVERGQTPEETQEINQQLMDASQETAVVVALEHLGYDVISGSGATVEGTVAGAPAAGVIEPGETIVRAGGRPVEIVDDLVIEIDALDPGDELDLVVEDVDGQRRTVTVELGDHPDAPGSSFLGVAGLSNRDVELDLPFEVVIDAGQVRGPSAGLAFTLAVLDVLTPGDLTAGEAVAVTGEIGARGQVGPVGGVDYKAIAAREAGAEVFLVPAGEEELAARRVGDDIRIVPVATLDDALAVLDELGGGALDLPPPVET